jgi:hypothetical protein
MIPGRSALDETEHSRSGTTLTREKKILGDGYQSLPLF